MITKIPKGTFCGETVRRMEIRGMHLSETVYPPSLKIPPHFHELANFCFVIAGAYEEDYGRRRRACGASTLVFHPEGEVHSDLHAAIETRIFCVELEKSRLDSVREHSLILDSPIHFEAGFPSTLGARLYAEFLRSDDFSPLALEGLVLETMATASRSIAAEADPGRPAWLAQAEEVLRSSVAQTISLDVIAQRVGVHPVHLSRTFRHKHRCTVGEYMRALRVEAACRLLKDPKLSLGDLALAVGFADQSHLTRTFKRLMGVTPGQYRRTVSR